MNSLSIIIPARNEERGLSQLLPELRALFPEAEIIVVNDASTDTTAKICRENNVTIITHPYGIGNGAAIKTGARKASGSVLVFMDADGQHSPQDIQKLLSKLDEGYDMAVGARQESSQASMGRSYANSIYN